MLAFAIRMYLRIEFECVPCTFAIRWDTNDASRPSPEVVEPLPAEDLTIAAVPLEEEPSASDATASTSAAAATSAAELVSSGPAAFPAPEAAIRPTEGGVEVAAPSGSSASSSGITGEGGVTILVPQAPDPPDTDPEHWQVTPMGYIRHQRASRDAGRLTFFRKNISLSCYMHAQCSVLRVAAMVPRERMVRWLISGRPCPAGATTADRLKEGTRHMATFE